MTLLLLYFVDCPPLHNIPNGTVSANDGLSTGKTANYSCESEFDLLGNRTRTCLENGQWSGQAPSCHIKGLIRFVIHVLNSCFYQRSI